MGGIAIRLRALPLEWPVEDKVMLHMVPAQEANRSAVQETMQPVPKELRDDTRSDTPGRQAEPNAPCAIPAKRVQCESQRV